MKELTAMQTKRLIIDRIRITDREDYFRCIAHDRRVLQTFVCRYAETPDEVDLSSYAANGGILLTTRSPAASGKNTEDPVKACRVRRDWLRGEEKK